MSKIEELINSIDEDMRALGVVLLLDKIKNSRDYHRYRPIIKSSRLMPSQKLLLKKHGKEESLKIWIDGNRRDK